MQLAERVVWITGASDGIGAALAKELAGRGATLVLTARRREKLEAVAAACGDATVHVLPADLLEVDAHELAAQAEALAGPIDVLVANAGQSQRGTAIDTDMSVVRRLMELNFFVVVALAQAVLPGMVARGRGRIVVTTSLAGHIGTPLRSTYSASKFALEGFFESTRAELHGTGVGVTIVAPGYIDTEISKHAMSPDGSSHGKVGKGNVEGLSAEKCAVVMRKAIERDRDHVFVGGKEVWAIYMKRLSPALVRRFLPGAAPPDEA